MNTKESSGKIFLIEILLFFFLILVSAFCLTLYSGSVSYMQLKVGPNEKMVAEFSWAGSFAYLAYSLLKRYVFKVGFPLFISTAVFALCFSLSISSLLILSKHTEILFLKHSLGEEDKNEIAMLSNGHAMEYDSYIRVPKNEEGAKVKNYLQNR